MLLTGVKNSWIGLIASALFAVSCFLLPVKNASAVPTFTYNSSFNSIDPARVGYMDVGGSWDGNSDESDTTGDDFNFTFRNTDAATAFDYDIQVNVPTGFRVPAAILANPNAIDFTSSNTGICPNINNVDIDQAAPGSPVTFVIPPNSDIPQNCEYSFRLGLTTNANAVTGNVLLNVSYSEVDNDFINRFTASRNQAVTVNAGVLTITKTTAALTASQGDIITFNVTVSSAGAGGMFDVHITDTLGASFDILTLVINEPGPNDGFAVGADQYEFPYIAAGEVETLTVQAQVNIDPIGPPCPSLINNITSSDRVGDSASANASVTFDTTNTLELTHNLNINNSYCEFCGTGQITLLVNNIGELALDNVVVQEDLRVSGLTYVPGSTTFDIDGAGAVAGPDPVVSGANNQILTWNIGRMDSLLVAGPAQPQNIEIIFQVTSNNADGFEDEELNVADRRIIASANNYTLVCDGSTFSTATPLEELLIRQPQPQVNKRGRNVSAGQLNYADNPSGPADTVYGHVQDDVIWRVEIANTGGASSAPLQDAIISDTIGGNFDINWVCNSEPNATVAITSVTGDPTPAGCVPAGDPVDQNIPNFLIDDPFGNPNNDRVPNVIDVDAPANGNTFIFYVGRILGACTNQTNTADIEWGCEEDRQAPYADGGIITPATNNFIAPAVTIAESADLSADVIPAQLAVTQTGAGVLPNGLPNNGQPIGSKGFIRITLQNNTGATVRNIDLTDTLPPEYVLDTSVFVADELPANLWALTPAYGNNYLGMIDSIRLTNNTAPGAPLGNTVPVFELRTTLPANTHALPASNHAFRQGDVITIDLPVIMIEATHYDLLSDLDVAPEVAGTDDPTNAITLSNTVQVDFEDICAPISRDTIINTNPNIPANPEDLDVNISDALYILTNNVGVPLSLTVSVTNNGGHNADDYFVYVSFGQAMAVQAPYPAGCSQPVPPADNPPQHPVFASTVPTWSDPSAIPGPLTLPTVTAPAAIFVCDRGVIAPGATENFVFDVVKQTAGSPADDLTFRADVIGEISQHDGTALTFPNPASIAQTTPNQQLANNYSLDAIRSRVLGFNLTKARVGDCTENLPPLAATPERVQIGEDCFYHIEAGGWFGFQTPGFTLIEVNDIVVTDDLPDQPGDTGSQGYIEHSFNNTAAITNPVTINGGVGSTLLDNQDIDWSFNPAGSGVQAKDHWFRVDLTTRILNDAVDSVAAPNIHSDGSTNIGRANFDAIFNSTAGNVTFCVSDTVDQPVAGCIVPPGYPRQIDRQVDLTIHEPNLTVVKDVCNESIDGFKNDDTNNDTVPGPFTECGSYADIRNDGDTDDSYVYRIAITNEAANNGVDRAPAYNVIVRDVLDGSDLMFIQDFATDDLDNDADGTVDEPGEGSIVTDNIINNANPAEIEWDTADSTALARIDPGQTVYLYYRVDPYITIAPLQTLTNTVGTSYDSLAGDFGNQSAVLQLDNNTVAPNDIGRARIYTTSGETARVQMLPLLAQPKQAVAVGNSITTTGADLNVAIGEEIRYELTTSIPVANLTNFIIQDTLPLGVRCIADNYPTINLTTDPRYSPAGFNPGGAITPTCVRAELAPGVPDPANPDVITWNFGTQALTIGVPGSRFDFVIDFVAQVENSAVLTNEGDLLRNGGQAAGGTSAYAEYIDDLAATITLDYAAADVYVREPLIEVRKSFAVANSDAGDRLTVTVEVEHVGAPPANNVNAYNVKVLDDLLPPIPDTKLRYVPGSIGGAALDQPDTVDTATLGADRPIFSWENLARNGYEFTPGEIVTFTFQVDVESTVEPQESLDNTIYASWTSLPDTTRDLSGASPDGDGVIDADGAPMGMRNGALPNAAVAPNDYEFSDTAATAVLPITFVKTDETLADVPPHLGVNRTIGAHRDFQLEITLPEGTTQNIRIDDVLNAAGLSYLIENDGTYNITYDFPDVLRINGTLLSTLPGWPTPTPEAYEGLFTGPVPADEDPDTVTWNIGTVETDSEDDIPAGGTFEPKIIINYKARINNEDATDIGDNLSNDSSLLYVHGENQVDIVPAITSQTGPIVVTEPVVTVSKDWVNVTRGNAQVDGDAGDVIEYTVTVDNTAGTSSAFDINIVDTIPTHLQYVANSATADIQTGVVITNIGGFDATPTVVGQAHTWGRGDGDEQLDVPAGSSLIFTYQMVVQNDVEPNQIITNSVVVDWTSLQDASALERIGTGGAACAPLNAYDIYCAADTSTFNIIDVNTIVKDQLTNSYVPANNDLRVGDTVDYRLQITLQEGKTDNVVLKDFLPIGLRFEGIVSINDQDDTGDGDFDPDPAKPFSYAAFDQTNPAQLIVAGDETAGTDLDFVLGDIVNEGVVDANDTNNNVFTIIYRARLVDAINPAFPQAATTVLPNTVQLEYEDVNNNVINPATLPRLESTYSMDGLQPLIETANLLKEHRGPPFIPTTPPSGTGVGPGTNMPFRLTACNVGAAPAYDVIVDDILPVELDDTTLTVPVVRLNGAGVTDGVEYSYNYSAAAVPAAPPLPAAAPRTMRFIFNDETNPLNPGQCIEIDFDIEVEDPLPGINLSWDNVFQIPEYHSLDIDNVNNAERETYPQAGPVGYNMNNITPIVGPDKTLVSPVGPDYEVTIGDIVEYQITVPGVAQDMKVDLFDVVVTDDLAANLTIDNVVRDGSSDYGGAINYTVVGNQLQVTLVDKLDFNVGNDRTDRVVLNVTARVSNDLATQNTSANFGNTAGYSFAGIASGARIDGGSVSTPGAQDVKIVEPELTLVSKGYENITLGKLITDLPEAGDTLRYTLVINAAGGGAGDAYSDAFDVSIIDTLSLGLVYNGNSTLNAAPISDPSQVGNGIAAQQVMTWDLASGANIDIAEGTAAVTITYEVTVLNSVLPNQDLTNTAVARWTSQNDTALTLPNNFERDGTDGAGALNLNNYETVARSTTRTVPDNNSYTKTRLTDTYGAGDDDVRVGDIIDYRITLSLQEGTSNSVKVVDELPAGFSYEGVVSINGRTSAPYTANNSFVYPTYPAGIPAAQITQAADTPVAGETTITWDLGNITNIPANDGNNDFELVYRVRVLNDVLAHVDDTPRQNSAVFSYVTASGLVTQAAETASITVRQPTLVVRKTSPDDGTDIIADQVIQYTIEVENTGTAPAYDVHLTDVIPLGLRNGTTPFNIISTQLPVGNNVANIAAFTAGTGLAEWQFDTGVANAYVIQPNEILQIVYEVQAESGISAGLNNITNVAQVQNYYSLDDEDVPSVIDPAVTGVRQTYGPTNTASVTLGTADADALSKTPQVAGANIGESFIYEIVVPANIMPTAIYDVRITDSLNFADIAADLAYVNVTRNAAAPYNVVNYVPENTGTVLNPVIEDTTTGGIDIPAGEQISVFVEVRLRDTTNNVAPNLFANKANYTFNQIDNVGPQINSTEGIAANVQIYRPFLSMDKRGLNAPANLARYGVGIPYTLVVENTGTGPAYDITVTDQLPEVADNLPLTGGTCDTVPDTFSATVYDNAEAVVVNNLTLGLDYTIAHTGSPTCELVITTLTPLAHLEPTEKLIVSYNSYLDVDSLNGAILTNNASVTEYFSQDTPAGTKVGEIRRYINDAASANDEDSHFVVVEAPVLQMYKTVINETTGQDPGTLAKPGHKLRYRINITNISSVPVNNMQVTDEPDLLNLPSGGYFVPGSMVVTNNGGGADTSNPNAGANAAGLLTISNLNLPNINDSVTIEFTVDLINVITSGTVVLNQGQILVPGFTNWFTDDPNTNGVDDPVIVGDEDPTEITIGSAPYFELKKSSLDITGDPNILVSGDVLRYTITAKNVGVEDAVNSLLHDNIPANTSYVASSTTLNGVAVADPAANVSPLQDGLLINAPENTTIGYMRAEANPLVLTNVSTVTFDVSINVNVVNGAVISNQAFVTGDGAGTSGVFTEQQSDDPRTQIVGDPTKDVVGNSPVLDVQKTVGFSSVPNSDVNGDGIVDPGDRLRYTFNISNSGKVDATDVKLLDNIPANTNYVANTTFLNNTAVAQPDGGAFPLVNGFDEISSDDLTPPLPVANSGVVTAGQSAVLYFDVIVDPATPPGTLITNQGTLTSAGLLDELTDADGIDENGDQATVIMVGADQEVSITKEVFVVGGGVAQLGAQLEYVIRVENVSGQPATDVIITDNLTALIPRVSFVVGSLELNGSVVGTSVVGNLLTANYGATYGNLDAGDTATMRFRVDVSSNIADFDFSDPLNVDDVIDNTAMVSWNAGAENDMDNAIIELNGTPTAAGLSGSLWHDSNFDDVNDAGEAKLSGWSIDIYYSGSYLDSVLSDTNGQYSIQGLIPNAGSLFDYELRYRAPGAGLNTASLGITVSPFVNDGPQQISNVQVTQSTHTPEVSLPIDPNGVVYDAVFRTPAADVRLEVVNSLNNPVAAACFDDPAQQNQITLANGYYKFDLNFTQATCPPGDDYTIRVYPQNNNYFDDDNNIATPIISQIVPPARLLTDPAFDVPNCPGTIDDTISLVPNLHCEIYTSEFAPVVGTAPRTADTLYFLKNTYQIGFGDNQIFNNHIAVDPVLNDAVAVTKTTPMVNVSRGQLIPYKITVRNLVGAPIFDLDIVDRYPAGFKYVANSARLFEINGAITNRLESIEDPQVNGLELRWPDFVLNTQSYTIQMLLLPGAGVGEGEYVNQALVINNRTGGNSSGIATATVNVVPDPTFDCSDVIGKVFDDKNMNGYQDDGEAGLPGTRVVTAKGLKVTADEHGRFHITCAIVPNEDRGSNFILKLDERSLPSGYRVTTENPRVQKATRGKMLKFNFGAAIHRVVRLDMADAVFEENDTTIRPQWRSRLDILIEQLQKQASILRLSYLADTEDEGLVDDRMQYVKDKIADRWQRLDCCYKLKIETEVFWRRGAPANREAFDE